MEEALYYTVLGLMAKYPGDTRKVARKIIDFCQTLQLAHVFDGGAGSGNFNHAGRPGLVGGSAPKGGGKAVQSAKEFFGPSFKEYSGQPEKAIEHLLKVKKGHVPAAIYKEGIGNIDFVYGEGGEKGYGLAHIIENRNSQSINGYEFVKSIPSLIRKGKIDDKYRKLGRLYIETEQDKAVIRLDYNSEDRIWLVTSFRKNKSF